MKWKEVIDLLERQEGRLDETQKELKSLMTAIKLVEKRNLKTYEAIKKESMARKVHMGFNYFSLGCLFMFSVLYLFSLLSE